MAKFIWTAKDEFGKTVVREVAADTIEESEAILLEEGLTELELKVDEIMDASGGDFDNIVFGEEVNSSPEEKVKYLSSISQSIFGMMFKRIMQDKKFYLICTVMLAVNIFFRRIDFAIIFGIVMFGWLIFRLWLALPEMCYVRLNKAKEWHRWSMVLEIVRRSEAIGRFHLIKLPESELIRSRAQALAGLGKLHEALEELGKCEFISEIPNWLHLAHLAGVYEIAKDHDMALEYSWQAVEGKQTPTLYIDLMRRLLRKRDIVKSREVQDEISKCTLMDITRPFYMRCCGVLAYLEGDYDLARDELEASFEIFYKNKGWPFRDGNIRVTKGHLSCVLAKLGEVEAAEKYFADAQGYLVATDEIELLDECKANGLICDFDGI